MSSTTRAIHMSLRRYFDATHLPANARMTTNTLMRAFSLGALLLGVVAGFNILVLGMHGHEVKIISQLGLAGLLLIMTACTRRGHSFGVTWALGILALGMVVQRAWSTGGLNAMACMVMVPIVIFSFLHAKRSIVAYALISYVTLISLELWMHRAARDAGLPEPFYDTSSALITLTLMLIDVMLVTWIVMTLEQSSLHHIDVSTRLMEHAKREAMEQSVEAERARHEVVLTQRAKARYLANMSHELRTPLSTIISYSELLEESMDEVSELPDHARHDVIRIRQSGQHLLRRINDILDLSRLEAGKMPIQREQIKLSQLFEKTNHFATDRASTDQGARLQINWPELSQAQDVEVWCDELLTVKLLAHLILHLKQDGPISVFVVPRTDHLDIIFKLRFWTMPPEIDDISSVQARNLHLLLYRELIKTLHLSFHEPDDATPSRPWSVSLHTR